jgi:hypothetical protein
MGSKVAMVDARDAPMRLRPLAFDRYAPYVATVARKAMAAQARHVRVPHCTNGASTTAPVASAHAITRAGALCANSDRPSRKYNA